MKTIDEHDDFFRINEIDKIITNLDIKKAQGNDWINNKLIKHLKPGLIKFLHSFFKLCINFAIHPTNWKIAKVIMFHKIGTPEDFVGSYRLLSLTYYHGIVLEKAVADNLIINWAESNNQQNVFRKNRSTINIS